MLTILRRLTSFLIAIVLISKRLSATSTRQRNSAVHVKSAIKHSEIK